MECALTRGGINEKTMETGNGANGGQESLDPNEAIRAGSMS